MVAGWVNGGWMLVILGYVGPIRERVAVNERVLERSVEEIIKNVKE